MRFFWKLRADDLFTHSAIVFIAMMIVHICNMVFQMAVGRVLPHEEYALLAAFLGVLTIIQRPLATFRTGLSYYSSLLYQDGRIGDVKRLLRKWILVAGGPALLACLAMLLLSRQIAAFLHLQRIEPVLIAGAVMPALFLIPIFGGVIQGLQGFTLSSFSSITGAVVRLFLGAGFVWFLYPACGWAMLGHGLGLYAGLGVTVLGLAVMLRANASTGAPLPSMRSYLFQSFCIQAAYAVLMTADVVFVKHYVPDDTEFAYAATLGRMVVFLPGAIVMAMFPKVTSRGTLTKAQRRVFLRSMGYTALFVFAVAAVCFTLPGLLVRILFGIVEVSNHLRLMVGLMAVVMGISALLNVVIQFLMAQHRFAGLSGVVLMALIYYISSRFCHETWHVVAWAGGTNVVALLWTGFIALRHTGRFDETRA